MGAQTETLTASELMQALAISKRTLYRYKARGMPSSERGGRSYFSLEACQAWMRSQNLTGNIGAPVYHGGEPVAYTDRAKAAARPKPSSSEAAPAAEEITNHSLLEARVRKERALAAKHQWAVEVARKEYIHRDEARALVAELAAAVRSALLALPGKVSARWAAITDPRELQRELEDTAADILRTWATAAERGAKAEEPEEDAA